MSDVEQPKRLGHLYILIYIDGPNAWGALFIFQKNYFSHQKLALLKIAFFSR
jgi:hypothetical protein